MNLNEGQIERFGRQILLSEVGGLGQQKILERGVRVRTFGVGIDVAVSYLAAGGSPIERLTLEPVRGFGIVTPGDNCSTPTPAYVELNPWGERSTAKVQVVVGSGVAFRSEEACEACWHLTAAQLRAAREQDSVLVGALAALAVQRLVLGLAEPLGCLVLSDGRPVSLSPTCCGAHQMTL